MRKKDRIEKNNKNLKKGKTAGYGLWYGTKNE